MTALPRALAPWAPELALFPADVGLALGQLASRLALAIGPMWKATSSRAGEPDGFDGVTRRGAYAHLLPSEWALADAVPDEFLRRASTGELAFLHVRQRQAAAGRIATALFDAGPSQIGGPRIAQLATLIVLSQRARAAGVRFRWGIVQRPDEGWVDDMTPATIWRLLKGRTAALPSGEHLREWATHLGRAGVVGQSWLVGNGDLGELAPELRATLVAIEDPLELGARAINVTCSRFRRPDVRIALELPKGALCARLLRDPFETARAAPLSTVLGFNPKLVLSSGARKVIVKHADGKLSLFSVPNSQQAQSSRVTTFSPPEGETAIATDWQTGRWRIVTERPGAFVLYIVAKGGGLVRPPSVSDGGFPLSGPGTAAGGITPLVRRRDGVECFVHPSGVGIELRGPRVHRVGSAKAVGRAGRDVLWVREGGPGGRWLDRNGDRRVLDPAGDGKSFFGWLGATRGQSAAGDDWLLAVKVQSGHWKIYSERVSLTLSPPSGLEVLGVTQGPALFLCEPDRQTLTLMGIHEHRRLPALADSLAEACACSSAPYVAYGSRTGELIVYSLERQATVLHVLPQGQGSS